MSNKLFPQEGEIWLIKFDKIKEVSKPFRPALVVSNNTQNEFDKNIVVAVMTTESINDIQLFEVFIKNTPETGLDEPSKILLNYPHTINKELRLLKHLGIANKEIVKKAKEALKIVLNLEN